MRSGFPSPAIRGCMHSQTRPTDQTGTAGLPPRGLGSLVAAAEVRRVFGQATDWMPSKGRRDNYLPTYMTVSTTGCASGSLPERLDLAFQQKEPWCNKGPRYYTVLHSPPAGIVCAWDIAGTAPAGEERQVGPH